MLLEKATDDYAFNFFLSQGEISGSYLRNFIFLDGSPPVSHWKDLDDAILGSDFCNGRIQGLNLSKIV